MLKIAPDVTPLTVLGYGVVTIIAALLLAHVVGGVNRIAGWIAGLAVLIAGFLLTFHAVVLQ